MLWFKCIGIGHMAPFEGGKTTGKKKICGFDKFTIIFCMLVAIIMIYKMPFY